MGQQRVVPSRSELCHLSTETARKVGSRDGADGRQRTCSVPPQKGFSTMVSIFS